MFLGKVVGGLIGLRFGGPIGALAGLLLGHLGDRWVQAQGWAASSGWLQRAAESQRVFTECVTNLAAKLAKIDGPVTRAEIDAFKAQFPVPPNRMAEIGALYNRAKEDPSDYQTYARRLAQIFAEAPPLLAVVLDALTRIALADGPMQPSEREFLEQVAAIFGIGGAGYSGAASTGTGGDPYAMLGVRRDAPTEEIKAAWRRLTREHHPDLLTAKGLSQDYVDMATRKMAEINAAWDQICAERGES